MNSRRFVIALGSLLAAACGASSELATVGEIASAADCNCSTNAATVGDHVFFDEVDRSGAYNDGGIKLIHALAPPPDNTGMKLYVNGDNLVGVSALNSYQKKELEKSVLVFEHRNGATYEVRIQTVSWTQFWTRVSGDVPLYEFVVRKTKPAIVWTGPGEQDPADGVDRPLCTGKPLASPGEGNESPYMAVVYEGDHQDSVNKTVHEWPPDDPHFNIGCIGTSMAKMHLIRHTRAGSMPALNMTTTVGQRQAMLKMFTADYCGTGKSFTENGQPLRYMDAARWFDKNPVNLKAESQVEAIWDERGAVCLNTPRIYPRSRVRCAIEGQLPFCTPAMIARFEKGGTGGKGEGDQRVGHVISGLVADAGQ